MLVHVNKDELLYQLAVWCLLGQSLGHARWLVDSWLFAKTDFAEGELVNKNELTRLIVNVVNDAELFNFRIWHFPWSLFHLCIIECKLVNVATLHI